MSWKLLDEPANDKLLFLKKDKEMVYEKDICYWKLYNIEHIDEKNKFMQFLN